LFYGHKTEYLILNLFAAAMCTTQLEDLQPLAVIKPGVSGESEMDLLSPYHWAEHEQQSGSMLLDGTAIIQDRIINICKGNFHQHLSSINSSSSYQFTCPENFQGVQTLSTTKNISHCLHCTPSSLKIST
jgi:hypothetical protein